MKASYAIPSFALTKFGRPTPLYRPDQRRGVASGTLSREINLLTPHGFHVTKPEEMHFDRSYAVLFSPLPGYQLDFWSR